MAYDKNVDYAKKMQEAKDRGDYTAAAQYEKQRNEKIADMNKAGTNTNGYTASNKYQGSSNTGTPSTSNKTSNTVKTNSSYNGNALSVDLNTDYAQKMIDAYNAGDYAGAAQYEALRNAKVNYLNSVGQNTNNYQTSNSYVNAYTPNKDSVAYTDKSFVKSNGVNAQTGELTYANYEDARQAAYDHYLANGGKTIGIPTSGDLSKVYNYIEQKNLVDDAYINAVQNGTIGQYNAALQQQKQAEKERLAMILSMSDEERSIYYNGASGGSYSTSNNNSFESDVSTQSTSNEDAYYKSKQQQAHRGSMRLY